MYEVYERFKATTKLLALVLVLGYTTFVVFMEGYIASQIIANIIFYIAIIANFLLGIYAVSISHQHAPRSISYHTLAFAFSDLHFDARKLPAAESVAPACALLWRGRSVYLATVCFPGVMPAGRLLALTFSI